MREPSYHFAGYTWTFPKGKQDYSESLGETARRETQEETGWSANLQSVIPQAFETDSSSSIFYLAKAEREVGGMDDETWGVMWVDLDEASELLNQTTYEIGRLRDLAVIEAAQECRDYELAKSLVLEKTKCSRLTFSRQNRTLVAVTDIHGHLDLFRQLVLKLDWAYGENYVLVTLGDYMDNGPQVKELLDFLIYLKATRPDRFYPIAGNHDVAALLTLKGPDESWYRNWTHYWFANGESPEQYGAENAVQFEKLFPKEHKDFLAGLPWFVECEDLFFVHAGLLPAHKADLETQKKDLTEKNTQGLWLMPQLRERELATVTDHPFPGFVISGHTRNSDMKRGIENVRFTAHGCLVHPRRITLNSAVETQGELNFVVFPENSLAPKFGCLGA
jgi:ADP-ribose pyrophosphatase YjhB (NUDIX family)